MHKLAKLYSLFVKFSGNIPFRPLDSSFPNLHPSSYKKRRKTEKRVMKGRKRGRHKNNRTVSAEISSNGTKDFIND